METILFKNANIFSLSSPKPFNWLLSENGEIVSMGYQSALPSRSETVQQIDLQNKFVIPAFGDAHLHSIWSAKALLEIDLTSASTLQQAITILTNSKPKFSEGEWIVGRGFNKNRWNDGQPHRRYLNDIFPRNPVYLESLDCHSAWVNNLALKICGISAQTADPPGGKFERDQQGQLTGLVFDRAMEYFKAQIPPLTEQQLLGALNEFVDRLLAHGITTIHAMEGLNAFELWQKLVAKYGHKMRVVFYIPQEELEELLKQNIQSGYGDSWLQIGGVKFFADGSLGSQTAALRQPYLNQPHNSGILVLNEQELLKRVALAEKNGLATAIHAIGDRAVELVLNVLSQTEHWRRENRLISRIEHAQLVPPDLLPRFRQYGLVASMQPIHIADDVKTAQKYWGQRSIHAYPFRSLLNNRVPLAFGSDSPVAEPDPIKGIFSAVHRRYQFNTQGPCWIPQETISLEQAVKAFTLGVAQAAPSSAFSAQLKPGQSTDFIVLNQNIFKSGLQNLLNTKVEMTILQGDILFSRL